jgi:hypothetical protein
MNSIEPKITFSDNKDKEKKKSRLFNDCFVGYANILGFSNESENPESELYQSKFLETFPALTQTVNNFTKQGEEAPQMSVLFVSDSLFVVRKDEVVVLGSLLQFYFWCIVYLHLPVVSVITKGEVFLNKKET